MSAQGESIIQALPITYTYPALFYCGEEGITATFPDLDGAITQGETTEEAIKMAKECLALHLFGMERDGDYIPVPSVIEKIKFDEKEIPVLIEAFMLPLREREAKKFVNTTVSMPNYLKVAADSAGINFSKTLQDAPRFIFYILFIVIASIIFKILH
jgi:predicted RNase H-like HicB family nuclease